VAVTKVIATFILPHMNKYIYYHDGTDTIFLSSSKIDSHEVEEITNTEIGIKALKYFGDQNQFIIPSVFRSSLFQNFIQEFSTKSEVVKSLASSVTQNEILLTKGEMELWSRDLLEKLDELNSAVAKYHDSVLDLLNNNKIGSKVVDTIDAKLVRN
jgi:hypothetical protein